MSTGEQDNGNGSQQGHPPSDAEFGPQAPPYAHQPPGGHPPPYETYGPYGPYPPHALPRHPDAATALALGVASLLVFPPLGPFAWSIGARVGREVATAPWRWSGEDLAKIGMVLGIIGTALCAIFVLFFLLFFTIGFSVLGGVLSAGFGATSVFLGAS